MKYLVLILSIIVSLQAQASKWIDLSWDEVEGAKFYEIEINNIRKGKRFPIGVFQSDNATYKKKVKPGLYQLRIRTVDSRGVPGGWSDYMKFTVDVSEIERFRPLDKEKIPNVGNALEEEVDFVWEKIEGITSFYIIIYDAENKPIHKKRIKGNSYKYKMKTSQKYSWELHPYIDGKLVKNSNRWSFALLGQALKPPSIELEEKDNHFEFTFLHNEDDVTYDFQLFRKKKDQYQQIDEKLKIKKNTHSVLKKKIRPGKYRADVIAEKSDSTVSYPGQLEFLWDNDEIEILGTTKGDERQGKNWKVEIKGSLINFQYESTINELNGKSSQDIPAFSFGVLVGYETRLGEFGLSLENADLTSSGEDYSDQLISLYYNFWRPQWGGLKFELGTGLFFRDSFFIRSGIGTDNFSNTFPIRENNSVSYEGVLLSMGLGYQFFEKWELRGTTYFYWTLSGDVSADYYKIHEVGMFKLDLRLIYRASSDLDLFLGITSHDLETDYEYNSGEYINNTLLSGGGFGAGVILYF
ncbi:MAG: hypothetical protein H6621_00615 [Halobacteriovoraceae bacterium]|nr:hypothetical protein [Halobacteriovoraceae bacterium]MCB9093542.1 hypothetical protein [Halobacteriovoraceae bacterium]